MPVTPLRLPAPLQPRVGPGPWAIDLPAIGGPGLAPGRPPGPKPPPDPHWTPVAPPSGPLDTNETYLNGRNLSYTVKGDHRVSLPYLTATMVDHTPADPLDLWAIGSYTLHVKAGRVDLREDELNGAIGAMVADTPSLPVSGVRVRLLDGNRVKLGARLKLGPLPVPVSTRVRVAALDARTVGLAPESIRVLGLPVRWVVRLFGLELPALMGLPSDGPLQPAGGGNLRVDLNRIDSLKGDLAGIGISRGRGAIVFGGAPDPEVVPARRRQNPNWAEVINKGEALLETGIMRNVRVVITDDTPQDPFNLNRWDFEGVGRVERGEVILPEKILIAKFAGAGGEGFSVEKVQVQDTDLAVEGVKDVLGFPIPVRFKLRFSASPSGELLMTPHAIAVAGMGFGKEQILEAIAKTPGMRRQGDAFVVDLRVTGSIVMPPLRRVSGEPGRIVLTP